MLNESAHSLTRCKINIHILEKAGMITRQNAWFANQEPNDDNATLHKIKFCLILKT